jgi:hypothetical protein
MGSGVGSLASRRAQQLAGVAMLELGLMRGRDGITLGQRLLKLDGGAGRGLVMKNGEASA